MAVIECFTTGSPPTNVVWQRNGEVVDVDGDYYETMQIVTNRRNSHYRNILVVNDVVSVIGSLTFTCVISNWYGSVSLNDTTNVSGMSKIQFYISILIIVWICHKKWSATKIGAPQTIFKKRSPWTVFYWSAPTKVWSGVVQEQHVYGGDLKLYTAIILGVH